MEYTTYIVDAQTLVDNIHSIKQWVYSGMIRVHIPTSSVEAVEPLFKKSLEPKPAPKEEQQQKRFSGRPRKEHPLFDINPRTAKEFLERAKSETGIAGVTFQLNSGKEEFTQWKDEDEKIAKANEPPVVPPNSFSEALLRKLNIAPSANKADPGPAKPKLVAKSSHDKATPFRYHKVPVVTRENIPEVWRPFFSAALWRVHEFENNPLDPETYVLLTNNPELHKIANNNELPAVMVQALRVAIQEQTARDDHREEAGMADADFPDVPRRVMKPKVKVKVEPEAPTPQSNGNVDAASEMEKRLEATALSAIEGLLDGLEDNTAPESLPVIASPSKAAAMLRPSFSYAMAAGAKSPTPSKPTSPVASVVEAQSASMELPTEILSHAPEIVTKETENIKPASLEDEPSSDEEVVVFVGKKRRSQDVQRLMSRPGSRPATSAGVDKSASPKPAKTFIDSLLKPQSPVFTPGQLYTPTSPTQQSIPEAYPTPVSKSNTPSRRASPSKREGTASPNSRQGRHLPPRPARTGNIQSRHITSEDAHRQSEMILQRQRDAIKRSAQIQEAQATRAQQQESKAPHREVELGPTATPVVIDPDDFGRDYTIRPSTTEHGNGSGRGSRRRGGGRGRGGKPQHQAPSMQQGQQQPQPLPPAREQAPVVQQVPIVQPPRSTAPDFVLKSGAPRGSMRGRGKLWVP